MINMFEAYSKDMGAKYRGQKDDKHFVRDKNR